MVSVYYADICTCPMPPAREILSDALALWIQLHTKYIHTAGNDGLSLLLLCTSILLCTLLDPNENTLALMMVPLCLICSPFWCPVSVRSWATHLRFEPSCIHIGPLSIAVYVLFSSLLVFILMIVLLCLIYAPVWCPVSVRSEESAQETKYLHRLSKVHLTRIAKKWFFWIFEEKKLFTPPSLKSVLGGDCRMANIWRHICWPRWCRWPHWCG